MNRNSSQPISVSCHDSSWLQILLFSRKTIDLTCVCVIISLNQTVLISKASAFGSVWRRSAAFDSVWRASGGDVWRRSVAFGGCVRRWRVPAFVVIFLWLQVSEQILFNGVLSKSAMVNFTNYCSERNHKFRIKCSSLQYTREKITEK